MAVVFKLLTYWGEMRLEGDVVGLVGGVRIGMEGACQWGSWRSRLDCVMKAV